MKFNTFLHIFVLRHCNNSRRFRGGFFYYCIQWKCLLEVRKQVVAYRAFAHTLVTYSQKYERKKMNDAQEKRQQKASLLSLGVSCLVGKTTEVTSWREIQWRNERMENSFFKVTPWKHEEKKSENCLPILPLLCL